MTTVESIKAGPLLTAIVLLVGSSVVIALTPTPFGVFTCLCAMIAMHLACDHFRNSYSNKIEDLIRSLLTRWPESRWDALIDTGAHMHRTTHQAVWHLEAMVLIGLPLVVIDTLSARVIWLIVAGTLTVWRLHRCHREEHLRQDLLEKMTEPMDMDEELWFYHRPDLCRDQPSDIDLPLDVMSIGAVPDKYSPESNHRDLLMLYQIQHDKPVQGRI